MRPAFMDEYEQLEQELERQGAKCGFSLLTLALELVVI